MQYKADVGANGNWELEVFDEFDIGSHAITASDNFGNEDLAIFHVKGKQSFEATEVQTSEVKQFNMLQIPGTWTGPIIIGGVLFLVAVIVILLSNYLLANKIQRKQHETHKRTLKLARKIMIVSAIFIAIFSILATLVGYQYGRFHKDVKIDIILKEEKKVEVSGLIRHPLLLTGEDNVQLTVGNVSITTSTSGAFNFSEVGVESGIEINHPDLQKRIKYIPPVEGAIDILYDTELFNRLIAVIDAQARGELTAVQGFLHESLADMDEISVYVAMPPIYKKADIANEIVTIINVEKIQEFESAVKDKVYTTVVRITAMNNGLVGAYNFIFLDEKWQYVL